MSDLRLPVRRLPVILVLSSGQRQEATVFLADGQDAGDLLSCPEPFLPAHAGGRIRLYARNALACVAIPPPRDGEPDDGMPHVRRTVHVHLSSGVVLGGQVSYVAPVERSRTADFLNEDALTFALYSAEVTYHIAKRHVAYVEEEMGK